MELQQICVGNPQIGSYQAIEDYRINFHDGQMIIFGLFSNGKETLATANQLYPQSFHQPSERIASFKSTLNQLFANKLLKKYDKKELESMGYVVNGDENQLLSSFNNFSAQQLVSLRNLHKEILDGEIKRFEEGKNSIMSFYLSH